MVSRAVDDPGVILTHPNRDKPEVIATKFVVILLLLISVGLMLVVTIGGWNQLAGAKAIQIGYILVYLVLAYYAGRWRRGVLPISAALATILLIFAAIAGPLWFERDKSGFSNPPLGANFLGPMTLLVIPVQILLILFAMRGFSQDWHVEIEQSASGEYGAGPPHGPGDAAPHPA